MRHVIPFTGALYASYTLVFRDRATHSHAFVRWEVHRVEEGKRERGMAQDACQRAALSRFARGRWIEAGATFARFKVSRVPKSRLLIAHCPRTSPGVEFHRRNSLEFIYFPREHVVRTENRGVVHPNNAFNFCKICAGAKVSRAILALLARRA